VYLDTSEVDLEQDESSDVIERDQLVLLKDKIELLDDLL